MVGTGWYSSQVQPKYRTNGDVTIRTREFQHIWWHGVLRYVRPDAIVVVDSNSPVEPLAPPDGSPNVQRIRLATNPGHATTSSGHYCGWTASVILSLDYAIANNAEAFVYVEQDVALFGQSVSDSIRENLSTARYLFGKSDASTQPLQQSFFAIRGDSMRLFLSRLHSINNRDCDLSPEKKFHIATAPFWAYCLYKAFLHFPARTNKSLEQNSLLGKCFRAFLRLSLPWTRGYHFLPMGYGRDRPISFMDERYYFQHGDQHELRAHKENIV